ncbi:hypothetical protein LTR09_000238 [Extremus antarcticus]|uniref:RING-type domain-containing protein n=1 Tax=Extremus antarcticus TaxID=702011 RepID=A0AAJ0GJF6_9PEZI|nr:hypothetical protein LTR09_000238 [Extremus antarcticus]
MSAATIGVEALCEEIREQLSGVEVGDFVLLTCHPKRRAPLLKRRDSGHLRQPAWEVGWGGQTEDHGQLLHGSDGESKPVEEGDARPQESEQCSIDAVSGGEDAEHSRSLIMSVVEDVDGESLLDEDDEVEADDEVDGGDGIDEGDEVDSNTDEPPDDADDNLNDTYDNPSNANEDGADTKGTASLIRLFVVGSVKRDEDDNLISIRLRNLCPCTMPWSPFSCDNGYHLFGKEIILREHVRPDSRYSDLSVKCLYQGIVHFSIQGVAEEIHDRDDRHTYQLAIKPDGDMVRTACHKAGPLCIAGCHQGYLENQEALNNLLYDPLNAVSEYRPLCPYCIGFDLVKQYHSLREFRDITNVDISQLYDFSHSLNARFAELGYQSQYDLDESEWNYHDNSDDDSEGEDDDDGEGDWEQWPDANDPNQELGFTPAQDATIAALPRKRFAEVEKKDGNAQCGVCMDDFEEQTVVVEMPCGHLFCESGCLANWLKNSNCCPNCRVRLPEEETEEEMEAGEYHGIARMFGDEEEEDVSEFEGEDSNGIDEMDSHAEGMADGPEPAAGSSFATETFNGGFEVDYGGW